jgi:thiamine pyrophosphokinase
MPAEGAVTTTILVLSGGGPAPTTALPRADAVIAADSGFHLAGELGLTVDLIVGDLDSIDRPSLEAARAASTPIESHPADKDATDLELALLAARDRGADRIAVAGGGAGRLDHLLAIASLLTDDRWGEIALEWHAGSSITHVVRGTRRLEVEPGTLVSVVPVTDCEISIDGTRWPLDHETLERGTTRGVSNEATEHTVTITVHRGVVFAITTGRDL